MQRLKKPNLTKFYCIGDNEFRSPSPSKNYSRDRMGRSISFSLIDSLSFVEAIKIQIENRTNESMTDGKSQHTLLTRIIYII